MRVYEKAACRVHRQAAFLCDTAQLSGPLRRRGETKCTTKDKKGQPGIVTCGKNVGKMYKQIGRFLPGFVNVNIEESW